jgi:hypothetical protein
MQTRVVVLAILASSLACASQRTSNEKAVSPVVTDLPAFPDTASLRSLQDVLANAQRVLDDTALFAPLHRMLQDTATFSELFQRIEAQRYDLERLLQDSERQRTLREQLERTQRALDRLLRRRLI